MQAVERGHRRAILRFGFLLCVAAAWAMPGSRALAAPEVRGPSDPKVNDVPPELEGQVQRLWNVLEEDGYSVARGYWHLFTVDECKYPIRVAGNCYGNNPTAPYILPVLPHWKDEYIDPHMRQAFGSYTRNFTPSFRMDEKEALVVLARLPPPAAYFGLQTYVYSRQESIDYQDRIYQRIQLEDVRELLFALSPNPDRVLTFSSIGNSNNHVVIEEQSGASFGQDRYFVITPDGVMAQAVTSALLRAGDGEIAPEDIFIEPVSPEVVRVGLHEGADDLVMLMRYALPVDEDAGRDWRAALPLVLLRVRDLDPDARSRPYPAPFYEERYSIPETSLGSDLEALVGAVQVHWGQPEPVPASFFNAYTIADLVGQHCLRRPENCLGDTQDTDTYRLSLAFSLDEGEVVAVVGTLATETGNATYTSLAVNRSAVLTGVANLSQDELRGSADAYQGAVADTDKFYVYYLARDCTGLAHCQEISESDVPRGEKVKLMQRNYMFPGERRGPRAQDLLNPVTIVFDGTHRPAD